MEPWSSAEVSSDQPQICVVNGMQYIECFNPKHHIMCLSFTGAHTPRHAHTITSLGFQWCVQGNESSNLNDHIGRWSLLSNMINSSVPAEGVPQLHCHSCNNKDAVKVMERSRKTETKLSVLGKDSFVQGNLYIRAGIRNSGLFQ